MKTAQTAPKKNVAVDEEYALPADHVLILRTCAPDMTSTGGFKWPRRGHVEAPDWSPEASCGQGLHGFLWGEGDGSLCSWAPDAVWLVVEVPAKGIVDLGGKVKFRKGNVVFDGARVEATAWLKKFAPGRAVVGGTSMSGDGGTSTSGDGGTSTSGHGGTSMSGDGGTSTSGYGGTSTSGDRGTSTSGYGGTSMSGYGGTIVLSHWDGNRRRLVVGYVGEDGIEAGKRYRLSEDGKTFVEVRP